MSRNDDFDDFVKKIKELSARSEASSKSEDNEMQTCISVVLPFLNALGYDHVKRQIIAQHDGDMEKLENSKVDFALKKYPDDAMPIMLVEVKKSAIAKLNPKHRLQLRNYFNNNKVKVGVLTNGVDVYFYADVYDEKKMDSEPFFEFNLQNDSEDKDKIEMLYNFYADEFDAENIRKVAKRQLLKKIFKPFLTKAKGFDDSDDEFIDDMIDKAIDEEIESWNDKKIRALAIDCFDKDASQVQKVTTATSVAEVGTFPDISKLNKRQKNALKNPETYKMYSECGETLIGWPSVDSNPVQEYAAFSVTNGGNFAAIFALNEMVRISLYVKGDEQIEYFDKKYNCCQPKWNATTRTKIQIELTLDDFKSKKDEAFKAIKEIYELKKNGG